MRYDPPAAAAIETGAQRPAATPPPPVLSTLSFSIGLALLVAVFLFLNPIWDAADMGAWNQNIWWSYVPIPLLIGVLLALERKLCRASLLLETMKMTFVKFTLTFVIAQIVWSLGGVPGTGLPEAGPVAEDIDTQRYEVRPAPEPSVIPAASTGSITGRVTDAAGQPLAGALVWISSGLEQFVFATPTQPALLENDGAGFVPSITTVQTFQTLLLRNLDEQLHTAVLAEPSGKRLLNYPVIPHGERALMFDRQIGLVHLHCTGHGAEEPGALLLVLSSPFATRAGPDGSFEFTGVPAGGLTLRAHDEQHALHLDLALSPGEAARADLAPAGAPTRTAERLNFVLILADDQGWTGTSVQLHPELAESRSDYYQTPNLQRLASEGMRFSSAYSSGPNCSPTRCSIMTGLGPARTGMTDLFFRHGARALGPLITAPNVVTLDAERVTLPEALKQFDASYRTAHFGKWHLSSGGPGQHGFDVHDGSTVNQNGNARVPDDPKRIFSVTERSIAFLREQAASEQPFFLQVSHFAVHPGTEALAETTARYEALPRGERHTAATYAAMTEDLDTGVGMLLDELEQLGLSENTYVFYFSDNGAYVAPEVTNNRPLRKGKASLWEGGIRVPLVVRGPGIEAGSRSSVRVVGHDLFPTLCDLTGAQAEVPGDLDGGSFKAVLFDHGDGTVERRDEFIVFHFPHYQITKGTTPQSAIVRGPYKLMKFWEDGSHELFAIDSDFGELRDLSGELPQLADELDALLVDYLRAVAAPMPTPNPDWDAAQQAEFDREFDQSAQ